ncbi:unnamed protein product [Choristocarpus tenellus]
MRQTTVFHNLPYPEVFEHETKYEEGEVTKNGTFCVSTGAFTGRSPKDKYFVKQVIPQGKKRLLRLVLDDLFVVRMGMKSIMNVGGHV